MLPSRVKGPGEYDAPLLRSSHPDRLLCNRENCITGSQKMYAGGPYVPARVRCMFHLCAGTVARPAAAPGVSAGALSAARSLR